jgi:hypothetical protein
MMDQRAQQQDPAPGSLRPVYWALAGEPLVLAAIAWFLCTRAVAGRISGALPSLLTGVFALASLGLVYVSFLFASGRYDQQNRGLSRAQLPGISQSFSIRVFAIALAAAPGILGLVLCLLAGDLWALAAFNGGAFLAASMHARAFTEQR